MPRSSYLKCPACKRIKAIEDRMLAPGLGPDSEIQLDCVRCTVCGACSIDGVVVSARGSRRRIDDATVRMVIAGRIRKLADRKRDDAKRILVIADEMDAAADRLEREWCSLCGLHVTHHTAGPDDCERAKTVAAYRHMEAEAALVRSARMRA